MIYIEDRTIRDNYDKLSFKEKIETARMLERLGVDSIVLPGIEDEKTDILFAKSISAFVKRAYIVVEADEKKESIDNALAALDSAEKKGIRICLPVSVVTMEYICHKKDEKMLELIKEAVSYAKSKNIYTEFFAYDATGAKQDFLCAVVRELCSIGCDRIIIADTEGKKLPDDFASLVDTITNAVPGSEGKLSVCVNDKNAFALSSSVLAVKSGACAIDTSAEGEGAPLQSVCNMFKNCSEDYGLKTGMDLTVASRTVDAIKRIMTGKAHSSESIITADEEKEFQAGESREDVIKAIRSMGYELDEEDIDKVYAEFLKTAEVKTVGLRELDALISNIAMQVPETYIVDNYIITTGNKIGANAQITLRKKADTASGIAMGDGPIDAAFKAIESIVGDRYELDTFQINSVTEGKEAMGSALIRLISKGKIYSGNGISTDIIGASIKAYVNAINKILFEEGEA